MLLETEPDDPDGLARNRREALATLNRLEAITDQLLSLMREQQPHDAREHHPVDLDEIVLTEVRRRGPHSPVAIDTTAVVAGQVHGRPDDLESLLDNLLSNVLRHARTAIAITVAEDQSTVELAVDDDGPGIDPIDRERVFERFTRLDEARNRDGGGAGLGLAIARAVVDAHRGSIAVETSPLGGARFLVRLPASTAATAPSAVAATSSRRWNPTAQTTSPS